MKSKAIPLSSLLSGTAIIIYLAILKLLIHFLFNGQYGYFRDELYYIACGEHLDFGYVDHPPLVPIAANVSRWLFGDSLFGLRFFPALAGALTVVLTGLFVQKLGGGRFAQSLAAIAVIISSVLLVFGNMLTVNGFDFLFWTLAAYILLQILKTNNSKLWLLFGLVVGIGLQNKYSIIFFGFGLFIGLLLSPDRKHFGNKWLWFGSLVALLVFLPNLIWQIKQGLPFLELVHNSRLYKNVPLSPLGFLGGQILEMYPLCFLFLVAGLYYYLISSSGKSFRLFGWAYIVIFAIFVFTRGKTYYVAPVYPIMFAAGAIATERFIKKINWSWLKPVTLLLFLGGGIAIAPMAIPVLPVEKFIAYASSLGINAPKVERHDMGKLPQHYADMFGWENMVATVAGVYNSLSEDEKSKCGIYVQNYGEAAAIDFFGKKYNLPNALCGHNNYWLWGPGEFTGEIMIVVGGDEEDHKNVFDEVKQIDTIKNEYAMPYENNRPVYLCRGIKIPITELWPRVKHYI